MATGRKHVLFNLDVKFANKQAKDSFSARLQSVRECLTPPGAPQLDNNALMSALFDLAEKHVTPQSSSSVRTFRSFMEHSG